MSTRNTNILRNALFASAACMALLATSPVYAGGCSGNGGNGTTPTLAAGAFVNGGAAVCAANDGSATGTCTAPGVIPAQFTVLQTDARCPTQHHCSQAPANLATSATGIGTSDYHQSCGPKLQGTCEYWLSEGGSNASGAGPDICQGQPAGSCAVCINDAKRDKQYVCDMPQNNPLAKSLQVNGALGAVCNAAQNGVCVVHSSSILSIDPATPCEAHLLCGIKDAASEAGY